MEIKAQGLDGFNIDFIKSCWDLIEKDVMRFINEFYETTKLPKSISASFLTLLPKKENPQDLKVFRPFSLFGSLYKFLTNMLAGIFKRVLGSVISECHIVFLLGKYILNGVLVVNEMLDYENISKKRCLVLKVDFEKAHGSVSWSFIDHTTNSISVLIRGSSANEFQDLWGLKQEPFSFVSLYCCS